MFQEFPYTNFHELNLDWIVKIAKDFLDQYTHIQEVIQTGLEDLTESRETGLAELDQKRLDGLAELNQKTLDGLADLQTKYDTLDGLLQAWYDTHSADIADQLADAIADFNAAADAKSQALLDSWPDDYSELVTEYNNLQEELFILDEKNSKWRGTLPLIWEQGTITSSGKIDNLNLIRTTELTVLQEGTVLEYDIPSGYSVRIYKYNSESSYTSKGDITGTGTYTASEDMSVLFRMNNTGGTAVNPVEGYQVSIKIKGAGYIDDKIKEVYSAMNVTKRNTDLMINKYWRTGVPHRLTDHDGWLCTYIIALRANSTFKLIHNLPNPPQRAFVVFYDKNMNYVNHGLETSTESIDVSQYIANYPTAYFMAFDFDFEDNVSVFTEEMISGWYLKEIDNDITNLHSKVLTESTDLNDLTNEGTYLLEVRSGVTFTHLPNIKGSIVGVLNVYKDEERNVLYQSYLQNESGRTYTRIFANNAWYDWNAELKEISILFVGNSLTQDGIAYLPYLLNTYYPDIKFRFYIWYVGGKTLKQHYEDYFLTDTPCTLFSKAENVPAWTNYRNSKTMESICATYKFDIVCMQEYFNNKATYTESDLADWNNCRNYITSHYTGGNALEFISLFHAPARNNWSAMPSGETTDTIFQTTLAGNNLILQKTIAQDMIPAGIAVYRALSTALDNLGDEGHLSPDGIHAQEGLPCLLQTFVAACWLFEKLSIPRSIYGSTIRMTTEIYETLNAPGANVGEGVITGTDAENLLAQEIAIKAYKEGKYYVENNIFTH